MNVKNIVILGSTGSIGINTLKVIKRFPNRFKVVGLTAYNNVRLLEKQTNEFLPAYVAINEKHMPYLKKQINTKKTKILNVNQDLENIVSFRNVDIVVIAMRGSLALKPFLTAVRHSKTIAPANKEAIVVAGQLIMDEAIKHKAKIIPIDSEQSAIFQCLTANNFREIKKIHLTASGGALLKIPSYKFDRLSVDQILKHPRWKMGKKITIDSATLMNKGFEIIEAQHLFNLKTNQINVVVHPEAIIHSMVEFKDGSIIAQLAITDMRLPIQYALTYPERLETGLKNLDFFKLKKLTFDKPDFKKFPCLALAITASKQGGTTPCVLNAADEEAVEAFLTKKISFTEIYDVVEKVLVKHKNIKNPNLDEILAVDVWARHESQKVINK